MNLFLDTEFTGLHQHTSLISLALVAEDEQAFYAEFTDYDRGGIDTWLADNVIARTRWLAKDNPTEGHWQETKLSLYCGPRQGVIEPLKHWLGQWKHIEVWADCPAWDWILFCELFGGAFSLPQHIYYLPFDLVTLFKLKGMTPDTDPAAFAGITPQIIEQEKHNALFDARAVRTAWLKLQTNAEPHETD